MKSSTRCIIIATLFLVSYVVSWATGTADRDYLVLFPMFTIGYMILVRIEKAEEAFVATLKTFREIMDREKK